MARVNVFIAPDISEDLGFAHTLLSRLSALPCQASLQSIDDLSVEASKGRLHFLVALGIPIFVLSATALKEEKRRQFIAAGNPLLHTGRFHWYYLTRDSKPGDLLVQFPDLAPLFENVMIVDGHQADDVLADLAEYLPTFRAPTLWQWLKLPFALLVALFEVALTFVLHILAGLELLGLVAGVVLLGLLAFALDSSLVPPITLLCCFAAGSSLYLVEALDIWPWLGPIWKSPLGPECPAGSCHADSSCTPALLQAVIGEYRTAKSWAAINMVLYLTLSLGPAAASLWLRGGERYYPWALCAFASGLLVPALRKLHDRRNSSQQAAAKGLTRKELTRQQRYVGRLSANPMPLPSFVDSASSPNWTSEEEQTIHKWFGVMAIGSAPGTVRSWLRRSDLVFVSYVWMDDPAIGLAEAIADGLSSAGVKCFLDKREGLSRFAPWRSAVARPLQEATHVILLISPRIGKARMIHAEMRTIIQRWYMESLPAVICVVEPDVAESLKQDTSTELYLRFFLHCCPKLTFEEARDHALLARVIRHRRRQGILLDLQTLITSVSDERLIAGALE